MKLDVIHVRQAGISGAGPNTHHVENDVDLLLWSTDLANVPRFYKQPFWEQEGAAYDDARQIEGDIRLESVADHSWKVADAVLLLAGDFPELNRCRCIELAVIHDKLELVTGDLSPIDEDATGRSTHAFNEEAARLKTDGELRALEYYLAKLRPTQREYQRDLYLELIRVDSAEARFVCGIDKLAALMYVTQRKPQGLDRKHYNFTVAYSAKSYDYFPPLRPYYDSLVSRLRIREAEVQL